MKAIKISDDYLQEDYVIVEAREFDESYLDDDNSPVFKYRSEYVIILESLENTKATINIYNKRFNYHGLNAISFKDKKCEIENLVLECFVENNSLKVRGHASAVNIKKETA